MTDDAPPIWPLTPLSRALADFDAMLDGTPHAAFFRNIETIAGMFDEQKRLGRLCQRIYLLTFVGAFLIFLGPLPAGAKISAGVAEIGLSAIPQQVIAFATASAYAFFVTQFSSLIVLQQMIERVLRREGYESWQFFSARFDASNLWTALFAGKTVGYASPKRHLALTILLGLTSLLAILFHSLIVLAALWAAELSAIASGHIFLKTVATTGAIIGSAAFLALIALVAVRMPFRLSVPDVHSK